MKFYRSTILGEWYDLPFPESMAEALELCGESEEALISAVGQMITHLLACRIRDMYLMGRSISEIDDMIADYTYTPVGPYRDKIHG